MRYRFIALAGLLIFIHTSIFAQPKQYSSSELLLQLKKLNTVGSVLYIAAHPDDENTRLIAYLANEKCLRTGYISLTRGDGGQNLIGPEQGVELGVIRTQELLASRRIDGGEQFFTRAYDFGYSKTPEETLEKWNKDSILSDMVWVIRKFRPDIIITRFATDGSGGHGHHTASAILAEEAFDAAGDPNRFSEQLAYVNVWQPRRLFWNVSTRFQNPNADMSPYIKMDVGGYNPLLGKSYGEIAAESRSMHKSQGFGSARQRGEYFEYFKPIKGDTANLKDIFQGMDFSWKRVKGSESADKLIQQIINKFQAQKPEASLPDLLRLRNVLAQPFEQYVNRQIDKTNITTLIQQADKQFFYQKNKLQLLDEIIASAAGLLFDVTSKASNTAVGDKQMVTLSVCSRLTSLVTLTSISYGQGFDSTTFLKLETNKAYSFSKNMIIPANKPISELYWLSEQRTHEGLFNIPLAQIGMPENNFYPDKASITVTINNTPIRLYRSIQYKWVEPEKGELYCPVVITPPVMINPQSKLVTFTDNKVKELRVSIKAGRDSVNGLIQIALPKGWYVVLKGSKFNNQLKAPTQSGFTFSLAKKGDVEDVVLEINPYEGAQDTTISITALVDGKTYTKGIKEIKYDHIPIQTLFPEAEVKLVKLDLVKKSKRIGYIPGAGDEVEACLTQLGYEVTTLTNDKLANENLSQYSAIITGVRAYNINEKLLVYKQKLMDYVANGGNLIVQYNTNSWAGPLNSDLGPYPFKISRNRVTEEDSRVTFLSPEHPLLHYPNKITAQDFDGWVQERSIYHGSEWDPKYTSILAMSDAGEKSDSGALLTTKYGKGNFVYTGLVFFRQLPVGVPGAYRLFVNLIEQE